MAFQLPNQDEVDLAHRPQAAPDATDIDILAAGTQRTGVVSGCAVTQRAAGANMSVDVASGTIAVAGTEVAVSSTNLGIANGDASNPRKDIVVVDNSGAISRVAGTAATVPVKPDIPANSVVLAEVLVTAGQTSSIVSADIIDKRVMLQAGDAAAGTKSLRSLGTGATQAAAGNDSRLSDTRTPTDNTVTTAKIANDAVDNTKLRNSAALSVIGRSANSTGDPADIAAASDGEVLRRSGTTLGFGQVATAGIANDAVDNTKLANMAASTLKGRRSGSTGDPEDVTLGSGLSMSSAGVLSASAAAGSGDWVLIGAGSYSGNTLSTPTIPSTGYTGFRIEVEGVLLINATVTVAVGNGASVAGSYIAISTGGTAVDVATLSSSSSTRISAASYWLSGAFQLTAHLSEGGTAVTGTAGNAAARFSTFNVSIGTPGVRGSVLEVISNSFSGTPKIFLYGRKA